MNLFIIIVMAAGQVDQARETSRDVPSLNEAKQIVIKAWERRAKYVERARLVWMQTDIVAIPIRAPRDKQFNQTVPKSGNWNRDTTKVTLTFDGDVNRRYERSSNTKSLSPDLPAFRRLDVKSADLNIEFNPQKYLGRPFERGTVKPVVQSVGDRRAGRLLGLFLRSNVGPLGRWDQMSIIDLNAVYQGHKCWLGRFTFKSGATETYWFSPEHDYFPLHTEEGSESVSGLQTVPYSHCIFQYLKDPKHGWISRSCNERSFTAAGQLIGDWTLEIVNYDINFPLIPDDFKFDFPEGTFVSDEVHGGAFLQRANGQKRWITENDNPSTWADLMATESGHAADSMATRSSNTTVWYVLFNFVAILLPLIALCWVRIRSSQKSKKN